MSLQVIDPGPLSLMQDLGRSGYQKAGVTTGGPMDEHAFLWANRLLGNKSNAAQIEITLGNFSCKFLAPAMIALTGADMGATINGQAIRSWSSHRVNPDDRLKLATARTGLRSYLAVSGGFQVKSTLGSCATVVRDKLGGSYGDGNPVQSEERLEYRAAAHTRQHLVPEKYIPDYASRVQIGVIPGYQYQEFTDKQRQLFFSSPYQVSNQIDRMGYRLSGKPVQCRMKKLVSEGIALGAIQIPPDGQPIVLLKDRQTIGGYPKIGCVAARDISRIAQCRPGDVIQFYEKDLLTAEAEMQIYRRFFSMMD